MTSSNTRALAERSAVWSRHWASGAAHSCAGSCGSTYGGTIAAFWRRVHDRTPPDARLLDLATGSGAVPRLWRQWGRSNRWDAVDLADIEPGWASEHDEGLRFHAGVRAEALPFPDASFDLVASQYGIEYTDLTQSMQEVMRVRHPQGSIALVVHHAESRPVSLARIELSHLEWALAPDGLVGAAAAMLGHVARSATAWGRARLAQDPSADAARLRFNAAQQALRERACRSEGADLLRGLQQGVGHVLETALRSGESSARSVMERLAQALSDHRWRLHELVVHALDAAALGPLVNKLTAAGLQPRVGVLHEGSHLMGWTIEAGPPGCGDGVGAAAPAVPAYNSPHDMRMQAALLDRSGRHAEAVAVYEQLLALQPEWLDGWYNLGQARWRARRFEAALDAYQRALDGGVRSPEEVHLNRAVILARHLERPDAAGLELERAVDRNPSYLPALLNLGSLCEQQGDADRALHWYGKVHAAEPGHALALSRLASLRTLSDAEDPILHRLAAALSEPGRSHAEQADLGFGLGKALDDLGRYDEAFAAYSAANAASRRAGGSRSCYDAQAEAARIHRLAAQFPGPQAEPPSAAIQPPIFICGMFRSGSTLIERVLAGHPRVTAGGELDLLPALAAEHLPPDGPWPVLAQPGLLARLSRNYLEAVRQRFPAADVVTDKRPDNFLHIGLIKALFPTARIVYTRRNPLDNCLSLFFLHLAHDMPWAMDLVDAGHWYRLHQDLMTHWQQVHSGTIHTVDYDRFVIDPETETRRLLEFCALEWEPACLDFHRSSERVQTASLWQVRRPLYRHASGRWRNYRRHLGALREVLGLAPDTQT